MQSFEQAWEEVVVLLDGESVSEEVYSLLKQAYETIIKQSPDFHEIKVALENPLSFLSTEYGRTNANCFAVDLFFTLSYWNVDWNDFPETLTSIIGDIGGALHDTVSNPDIARNFNGLPEQLLERVKQWEPK